MCKSKQGAIAALHQPAATLEPSIELLPSGESLAVEELLEAIDIEPPSN